MEYIRFVMSSITSKFFQALYVECSYCLYSVLGRAVSKHRKEQGRNNHACCGKIQQQQKKAMLPSSMNWGLMLIRCLSDSSHPLLDPP